MTNEQKLKRMIEASKEDRERVLSFLDKLERVPKYKNLYESIQTLKQQWRDMTSLPNYPEIDFPLAKPDWCPKLPTASCWKKDYLKQGDK